ncbi:E3 ubiquitin-protein ligase dtx3l [Blyttiomyces sp. JEL0837]|nr:E3 ubiquitin-protein ligase dtx3l [Blyttiomyces sp. JEL0837]
MDGTIEGSKSISPGKRHHNQTLDQQEAKQLEDSQKRIKMIRNNDNNNNDSDEEEYEEEDEEFDEDEDDDDAYDDEQYSDNDDDAYDSYFDNDNPLKTTTTQSNSASLPPQHDCPICGTENILPANLHQLQCCPQSMCKDCFQTIQKTATTMKNITHTFFKCPFCSVTDGVQVGDCPNGDITFEKRSQKLPGYENSRGTYEVHFSVPGHLYRKAYLPICEEGDEVKRMMELAFYRRLCFRFGVSATTGKHGLVWNIHCKTSMTGGTSNYGYPDDGYLKRVTEELKARGIE